MLVLLLVAGSSYDAASAMKSVAADSGTSKQREIEEYFEGIASYWRSDPATGATKALEEIRLATRRKDSVALGFAWCALGINQWGMGQNVEAARSYMAGIGIGKKWGNRRLLAKSYNNLGLLYFALGSMTEAKSLFFQAAALRKALGDSAGLGRVRMNLGLVARREGHLDSAMMLFSSALRLMIAVSDSVNIARGRHYVGECHAAQGRYMQAVSWYSRADSVFRLISDRMGRALLYVDLAKARKATGDAIRARRDAERAFRMGTELQAPFVLRESAEVLQELYASAGAYRQAYHMLRLSAQYADSLRHESTMHALTGLELRNALEQERQAELSQARRREDRAREELRRARVVRNITVVGLFLVLAVAIGLALGIRHVRRVNTIVTEKKREIEEMNELLRRHDLSRERLFSIIGHDLRGPMGSIVEIFSLLSERGHELTSTEKEQLWEVIRASAEASFESLENLLHWSRSQRGDLRCSPTSQPLRHVLDATLAILSPAAQRKGITLETTGNWETTMLHDRSILVVVLRNLLSNALKFSDSGGVVVLDASVQEGNIRISVRDAGIGIVPERLEEIRQRRGGVLSEGTTGEEGTGLGLELCQSLLQCHGGHLEIQSTVGKGSEFTAVIPSQEQRQSE
ncbi:MAG: tetratricopeptide repeat-containing sensor histidine kinase [Bacteroidia bacterium]|nr:tetratricopeptide repeat-containing sensor histidine kinase [Bacteroidia bacterium]